MAAPAHRSAVPRATLACRSHSEYSNSGIAIVSIAIVSIVIGPHLGVPHADGRRGASVSASTSVSAHWADAHADLARVGVGVGAGLS